MCECPVSLLMALPLRRLWTLDGGEGVGHWGWAGLDVLLACLISCLLSAWLWRHCDQGTSAACRDVSIQTLPTGGHASPFLSYSSRHCPVSQELGSVGNPVPFCCGSLSALKKKKKHINIVHGVADRTASPSRCGGPSPGPRTWRGKPPTPLSYGSTLRPFVCNEMRGNCIH